MNDSLQLSDPHFFQEMRTFSTGNSKKKKMHMLSVIDRYTVNEVVIDLWRGAGVKFERAEERERERERAIENYWKFSSLQTISLQRKVVSRRSEKHFAGENLLFLVTSAEFKNFH